MSTGPMMAQTLVSPLDTAFYDKPQMTYFKSVYKRSTRFSRGQIIYHASNGAQFGGQTSLQLIRSADLLGSMFAKFTIGGLQAGSGETVAWTWYLGYALIKQVRLIIGAQQIDTIYGRYMYILASLNLTSSKKSIISHLTGNTVDYTTQAQAIPEITLHVPLEFFFCKRPGLFLPTVALQYNNIILEFQFEQFELLINKSEPTDQIPVPNIQMTVVADVYYITDAERAMLCQNPQEYIIPQCQMNGNESWAALNHQINLNFNLPVAELYWAVQLEKNLNSTHKYFEFSYDDTAGSYYQDGPEIIQSSNIKINNVDYLDSNVGSATYTNMVQPFYNHTSAGPTGVHSYAFALEPEKDYPCGTLNFSKISNAQLSLTLNPSADPLVPAPPVIAYIFAKNYNVFRCVSGLGGNVFSA